MSDKHPVPAPTGRAALDCGEEIKHQAKAFSASLEFVKIASGKFGLSTNKIDALSTEGEVLSEMLGNYCRLYRVSDETTYPTSEYRKDIGEIGEWQVKMVSFGLDVHTEAAGDKKADTADKAKKESALDTLVDGAKALIGKGRAKTESVPPATK